MKRTLIRIFPPGNYDAIPAALAGFFIIHVFTRHSGIGVSPDSVVYMSVASNLYEHGILKDFSMIPVADFPCFYPVFLAFVRFIARTDIMCFAPFLNGLLFAMLIYLSGWIMEKFTCRSKLYKWILLVVIVASPCLLEIYSMLWSETLFILLTLLFIPAIRFYFKSYSLSTLFLAGGIAALACITRYAGITLPATAGLLILLDIRMKPAKKMAHMIIFGLTAVSLLALNLLRNVLINGTLTGHREKGITSFRQNMHDLGSVFCDWLPFFNGRYAFAEAIAAFWIIAFIALFIRRRVKESGFHSYDNIATAFFIVYFLFIVVSATLSRYQTLNSRLLSPLFIPWIWGASSWIPGRLIFLPDRAARMRMAIGMAGLAAAVCFLWGQWLADNETWDGVKDAGIPGYTEDPWRNSETIKYVQTNKDQIGRFQKQYTLYSNAPDAIWFFMGLHSDMLPHKDFKKDIAEFLAEKSFYIIWFNDGVNPDLIPIEYISAHKKLVESHLFGDGAVYRYTDP